MSAKLRSVPQAPVEVPEPDVSYEWRDRQRIASRDWAKVHTTADRRPPLHWFERLRGTWRA